MTDSGPVARSSGDPVEVVDELGRLHALRGCLGRGGQGSVFAVAGGRLAAKILSGTHAGQRDRLRQRLAHVRRLPIDDLPIAKPLELLAAPHAGYLMPLLADVVPIRELARPAATIKADTQWYQHSGGLRRRLLVLARAVDVFSQLHARALAYGDPSPWNVLVSKRRDRSEVWLIDADNLVVESSPTAAATMLYTPGYGAPELVSGQAGISTLTDAHAISVLAYQTLVLTHPLLGDRVLEGDPAGEEDAYAGKLPWIDDPSDPSNRSSYGIKRDTVLSPKLKGVFARAFSVGLQHPLERPGATKLADALYSALDFVRACASCHASHYGNQPTCPWCGSASSPCVIGSVYRWVPADVDRAAMRPLHFLAAEDGVAVTIGPRIAGSRWKSGAVQVVAKGKSIDISTTGDAEAWIGHIDGSGRREIQRAPTAFPASSTKDPWVIHMGAPDEVHRIVQFTVLRPKT